MNETAQLIVDYISAYGPALTAIASIIASTVAIFRRTKSMNNQQLIEMQNISRDVISTTKSTQDENLILRKQLSQVLKDNQEIKNEIKELTAKVKTNGRK